MTADKKPETLQEAIAYFADPERAFNYAVSLRWPNGKISCPRCGGKEHSFISTRHLWFCKGCEKQFTVKVGTIFEDSALGLDKWMTAVWMLANCKNGISSYELGRALGITQKSAWFMLQRIRLGLQGPKGGKLGGEGKQVEVDETFIGAKARNVHKNKRAEKLGVANKAMVLGVLERGGHVRARVTKDRTAPAVCDVVREHVLAKSPVFTDKLLSYKELDNEFEHKVVDHADRYVEGQVHTNGLENFWSLLKRCLGGTYVSVEPFHLFRYVDEEVFRYNHRKDGDRKITDAERFRTAMSQVAGKRLTYDQLTSKSESPHHETTGAGQAEAF